MEIYKTNTYSCTMKQDAALIRMLQEKCFTEENQYGEVLYTRSHDDDARIKIVVRTGIPHGKRRKSLRVSHVRVSTILVTNVKTYGIGSFEPLVKMEPEQEFLDKVLKTMRDAYVRGTEWLLERGGGRPHQDNSGEPRKPAFRGGFIVLEQEEKTPLDEL